MSQSTGIFNRKVDAHLSRSQPVDVESVGDRLWTASAGTYRTVFAEGGSTVVAFNTFGTPVQAVAHAAAIGETVADKPIGTIVVTIDHLDHAGFAADLAPGADIAAHELTAKVIAGRGASGQTEATTTFRDEAESVEIDGVRFTALYPGPTQGTGNLAIHFADHGAVFMVGPQSNARYGLFPDFHIEQYPNSMRRVLALDFETFIPGRYASMSKAEAERAVAYFEALAVASQRAFANGVPIWVYDLMKDFCANALAKSWGDLDGFDEHVGTGAIRLVHHYLMGGWGIEDTQKPATIPAT